MLQNWMMYSINLLFFFVIIELGQYAEINGRYSEINEQYAEINVCLCAYANCIYLFSHGVYSFLNNPENQLFMIFGIINLSDDKCLMMRKSS